MGRLQVIIKADGQPRLVAEVECSNFVAPNEGHWFEAQGHSHHISGTVHRVKHLHDFTKPFDVPAIIITLEPYELKSTPLAATEPVEWPGYKAAKPDKKRKLKALTSQEERQSPPLATLREPGEPLARVTRRKPNTGSDGPKAA